MTREEIIRMARQVRDGGHWNQLDLINFANLVAAHTLSNIDPSTFMSCQEACEAARLAEREACAKVCEDKWVYTASASEMAEYIRARGKEGMSDYADNLRKSIINAGKKFTEMVEEVRRKQNEADREEILHMARDAGLHLYVNDIAEESYALRLERFAALVAASERKACAKLCEDDGMLWGARYAAKIRARGEK